MTDTATMLQQLEDLRTAFRTGATSISYEGKNVTYRSGAEMQALRIQRTPSPKPN